jgi:hypothetical protein
MGLAGRCLNVQAGHRQLKNRNAVHRAYCILADFISFIFDLRQKRPSASTDQSAADANLSCEDLLFAPSLVHVCTADLLTQNVCVGT